MLVCVVVGLVAVWWALVDRRAAGVVFAVISGVLLVGAVVLVALEGPGARRRVDPGRAWAVGRSCAAGVHR